MTTRARISLTLASAIATAIACGGGGDSIGVSQTCTVSSVTVTPSTVSIPIGGTSTLTANPASSNCNPQPAVGWESDATGVATVSNAGIVSGVGAGVANIKATAGGKSGTAVVAVTVPVASVTLTAPSASVAVGGSLQATAEAKDAAGNVLSGRVFTWQTSNATIANVSNTGAISGIVAGSVTITASTEGKSATLNVTVTGTGSLTITARVPVANAANVSIESPVTIQFSSPINPASVSATTVRVSLGGTQITGTLAVNGNTVTFTPAPIMAEFNAMYTVTVTTGVLSNVGNFLSAQNVTTFTTVFFDPSYYYRVTNQSLGPTQSLDTFAGSFSCFMGATSNASGQNWYFSSNASPAGFYAMRNQFQGDSRALEGADGTIPCQLNAGPIATGQNWQPVAFGAQFPNAFRLQNQNFGAGRSLDVNVVNGTATPSMLVTGNSAAQAWLFTRLGHR